MRVQSNLDLTNNEIRNARLQSLPSDPVGLGTGDAGRAWYNTATAKAKAWNGTAAENLTNLLEAVASGTTALGVATANKTATLTVADASGSASGLFNAADYNLLHSATSSSVNSSLVQRDASGNFSAATISAALNGTASNATNLAGQTLAQVRDFSLTTGVRDHTAISDFDTQVRLSRLDQMALPTIALNVNNQRITNALDPSGAQDVATKAYVDGVASGLDTKASVRLATTGALPTVAYAPGASGAGATLTAGANGALTVDAVAPAAGNRILVKDQATAAQNGIYTVTNAGGASAAFVLTRATDADVSAEITPGMFTFVEEGTTNAKTGWVMTTAGAITVGTTAQTFTQFSGAGTYTAGTGLSLTGSAFSVLGTANRISVSGSGVDIAAGYLGQTSITTLGIVGTGTWQGTAVGVLYGGTGATTAAGARTALGATTKVAIDIPVTAANTPYQYAHNLNTRDVHVGVVDNSTGDIVLADIKVVDPNNVSVTFGGAVAASAYRLVIVG